MSCNYYFIERSTYIFRKMKSTDAVQDLNIIQWFYYNCQSRYIIAAQLHYSYFPFTKEITFGTI